MGSMVPNGTKLFISKVPQSEKLRIFLLQRFYVESIPDILVAAKLQFLTILEVLDFDFSAFLHSFQISN